MLTRSVSRAQLFWAKTAASVWTAAALALAYASLRRRDITGG